MNNSHIIKYDYKDGEKLPKSEIITYCGYKLQPCDWYFTDAQHAICAMEQNTSIVPCKKCTDEMINIINNYHEG